MAAPGCASGCGAEGGGNLRGAFEREISTRLTAGPDSQPAPTNPTRRTTLSSDFMPAVKPPMFSGSILKVRAGVTETAAQFWECWRLAGEFPG